MWERDGKIMSFAPNVLRHLAASQRRFKTLNRHICRAAENQKTSANQALPRFYVVESWVFLHPVEKKERNLK